MRFFGPIWRELGIPEPREAFRVEVDRVLSEASVMDAAIPDGTGSLQP